MPPGDGFSTEDDLPAGDTDQRGHHERVRWWRTDSGFAVIVLLAYLLLAAALFHRGLASISSRHIGTPGDPILGMWALRWTPYSLLRGQSPLFTDYLNYPFGVNLMWNSPLILHSLALWPVTALAGPIVAYNVFVVANVAVSGWCAFLALRRFVRRRTAAVVGGLLYGFSPYMVAQSRDHPTLTAAYVLPLLLIVLHEIFVRQERSPVRMGVALGLLAAVQLFIAEEMLAIQALMAFLGLVMLVVLHPRSVTKRVRYAAIAAGVALVAFLVPTAWALQVQFFGPQRITSGTAQEPNVFVSDLANLVVPTTMQQLAPTWTVAQVRRWSGNLSELHAYVGIPLLLVLVFTVVRRWSNPVVRFSGLLCLVTTVLSLGPNLHVNGHDTRFPLPWRLIEPLPLLGHILPTRLMVVAFLLMAVVVAHLVDGLRPSPSKWLRALGLGAGAAVVATLLPTLRFPSTNLSVPRFFTDGSAAFIPEGSVALIAPFQQLFPADPMLWQTESGMRFRIPQGYFFAPDEKGRPRYGAPFSVMSASMYSAQGGKAEKVTPELRGAIAQDLAARDVQTVLVGPMEHQDVMVRFFEELFDARAEQFGDVFVWRRTHRLL